MVRLLLLSDPPARAGLPGGDGDPYADHSRGQRHGKPRRRGLAQNLGHKFPHPSAWPRKRRPGPRTELVACTLLAGGGRLRVPMGSLFQSAIRGSAKSLFFSDLFTRASECGFPARNEPLVESFSPGALPLAQRGRACWRKWKRSVASHGPLPAFRTVSKAVTICFRTRLIRAR